MSESLNKRVKRIISANVNDLVDSLENANAEAIMKEAIREVDRATDDVREELGHVIARRHRTIAHIERLKNKLGELSESVNIAVGQNRDDLASAAISRQIDLEGQVVESKKDLELIAEKQSDLEGYVAALVSRRKDMAAEFKTWKQILDIEDAGYYGDPRAGSVRDAEKRTRNAEDVFERVVDGDVLSVDGAEKRAVAGKLGELDKISRQKMIAARLAAAKPKTSRWFKGKKQSQPTGAI